MNISKPIKKYYQYIDCTLVCFRAYEVSTDFHRYWLLPVNKDGTARHPIIIPFNELIVLTDEEASKLRGYHG